MVAIAEDFLPVICAFPQVGFEEVPQEEALAELRQGIGEEVAYIGIGLGLLDALQKRFELATGIWATGIWEDVRIPVFVVRPVMEAGEVYDYYALVERDTDEKMEWWKDIRVRWWKTVFLS